MKTKPYKYSYLHRRIGARKKLAAPTEGISKKCHYNNEICTKKKLSQKLKITLTLSHQTLNLASKRTVTELNKELNVITYYHVQSLQLNVIYRNFDHWNKKSKNYRKEQTHYS